MHLHDSTVPAKRRARGSKCLGLRRDTRQVGAPGLCVPAHQDTALQEQHGPPRQSVFSTRRLPLMQGRQDVHEHAGALIAACSGYAPLHERAAESQVVRQLFLRGYGMFVRPDERAEAERMRRIVGQR